MNAVEYARSRVFSRFDEPLVTSKPDQDPVSWLSVGLELPAGFASLSPSNKLKVLMDLPDPGRVVARLRPDELFFMLKGIGIGDSYGLLAYATPEQRQAYVDLDTWSGWHYEPARFDQVLDLAREISSDVAKDLVKNADPEQLALHLFKRCTVTLAHDEEDNPTATDNSFLSPDNAFFFTCRDPDDTGAVRRLLDIMFAVGVPFAQRIIFSGMYDTVSSLEEQSFSFRNNRLQDLGFPLFDERFDIFDSFDAGELKARFRDGPEAAGTRPVDREADLPLALVLQSGKRHLFFWDAVALIEDRTEIAGFMGDMLYLVNRVLGARQDDLSRDSAWEDTAAHCLKMASLGLEDLAGGDPERAATVLSQVNPVELYRNAVEVLRPIHLAAVSATRLSGGLSGIDVLGERRSEAVRAGLFFPPRFWTGLSGSGSVVTRDFEDMSDVKLAKDAVGGARDVLKFALNEMGFSFNVSEERSIESVVEPTLANVLATAWARGVIGSSPSAEPLSGNDVRDLVTAAFEKGRIRPDLRKTAFEDNGPVDTFLNEALDAVEETLGKLDPAGPVDTRFLGNALLFSET